MNLLKTIRTSYSRTTSTTSARNKSSTRLLKWPSPSGLFPSSQASASRCVAAAPSLVRVARPLWLSGTTWSCRRDRVVARLNYRRPPSEKDSLNIMNPSTTSKICWKSMTREYKNGWSWSSTPYCRLLITRRASHCQECNHSRISWSGIQFLVHRKTISVSLTTSLSKTVSSTAPWVWSHAP